MANNIFEETAADKSQLGFDYQDLVCLEYLIDLEPGESVGLEVLDDIHHERIDGVSHLVQVKHSVGDNSTLKNRDIDLWKTLYIWSRAIEELETDEVEFILYTNKKKTNRSGIVHLLDQSPCQPSRIVKYISETKKSIDLKESKKEKGVNENPIKKYIDHLDDLSQTISEKLFSRIHLIFSCKDIFERLAKKIEYFAVSKEQSFDVLHHLIGVFKKKKYEEIQNDKKLIITYEKFRIEYQFDRIIKITQDRKIDFSKYYQFKNVNEIDPKSGIFAKQLSDIGISQEEITDYAIEYAATVMFIQKLIANGEFTEGEDFSINEEMVHGWKMIHREIYNQLQDDSESDLNLAAQKCFYKVNKIGIQVSNSLLSPPMVLGKGIELSDVPRIGWRKDWYDIYGKCK